MTDEIDVCPKCRNVGLLITSHPVRDTAEFCDCAAGLAMAAGIEEGIRDIKSGHTRPWAEVRRELGLEQSASPEAAPERATRASSNAAEVILAVELACPRCGAAHVDAGEWESKPHRTHKCLACYHEWAVTVRGTLSPSAVQGEERTWRVEGNVVWTRHTGDPELVAANVIEASRLAHYLNSLASSSPTCAMYRSADLATQQPAPAPECAHVWKYRAEGVEACRRQGCNALCVNGKIYSPAPSLPTEGEG